MPTLYKQTKMRAGIYYLEVLFFFWLAFMYGCSQSVAPKPIFKTAQNVVLSEIGSMNSYEDIVIQTSLTSVPKKGVRSILTIRLINGLNLPKDKIQLKNLGRQVASKIKVALQNADDFHLYKVLWVIQANNTIVSTSNYEGFSYETEELTK